MKYTFIYQTTVTPKKFRTVMFKPFNIKFEHEIELQPVDAGNIKAYEECFKKEIENGIEIQVKHLDSLLNEWNETIEDSHKNLHALSKAYKNLAAADIEFIKKREEPIQKLLQGDTLQKEVTKQVDLWIDAICKTQGQIAIIAAAKSSRLQSYERTNTVLTAKLIGKVVLLVLGTGASIAGIVTTAGAAAPLILGLTSAAVAFTGLAKSKEMAEAISNTIDEEKRTLDACKKDISNLQKALGAAGNNVENHIKQLTLLHAVREDEIKKIRQTVQMHMARLHNIAKYAKGLAQIGSGDPFYPRDDYKKLETEHDELLKSIPELLKCCAEMVAANKQAAETLNTLQDLNVKVDELLSKPIKSAWEEVTESIKEIETWSDGAKVAAEVFKAAGEMAKMARGA